MVAIKFNDKYHLRITVNADTSENSDKLKVNLHVLVQDIKSKKYTKQYHEVIRFDNEVRYDYNLISDRLIRRFNQIFSTSPDLHYVVYLNASRGDQTSSGYVRVTDDSNRWLEWEFTEDEAIATPITFGKAMELVNAYEEFNTIYHSSIRAHKHNIVITPNVDKSGMPL